MSTSEKIKLLLKKYGFTQSDIAKHLGVVKQDINRSMHINDWQYDELVKISMFFNSRLDIYFVIDGARYRDGGTLPIQIAVIFNS